MLYCRRVVVNNAVGLEVVKSGCLAQSVLMVWRTMLLVLFATRMRSAFRVELLEKLIIRPLFMALN